MSFECWGVDFHFDGSQRLNMMPFLHFDQIDRPELDNIFGEVVYFIEEIEGPMYLRKVWNLVMRLPLSEAL